jgi:hypothetical protein
VTAVRNKLVQIWFGERFNNLHPLLQKLHLEGGALVGNAEIFYGRGLAGIVGRRLGRKMNLPEAGVHRLMVNISHDEEGLHWERMFGNTALVKSLFKPVGCIEQGYWIETTGPLVMRLTVDIHNSGWFWRCLKVHYCGVPIPLWLIPGTNAYKIIEEGKYRFYVGFSFPVIGAVLSYQGLLSAEYNQ